VILHEFEQEILDRNPLTAKQFGFSSKPAEGKTEYINENNRMLSDEDELKILFVPGHSPGSIAYHTEAQKLLNAGQVLSQGSMCRTELYTGCPAHPLENVEAELYALEDESQGFSERVDPTTIEFKGYHNALFYQTGKSKKSPFHPDLAPK